MSPRTIRGRVSEALANKSYSYADEVGLHRALAAALDEAGIEHQREMQVVGGRIDFVVFDCGVEVKVKGTAAALGRQIVRYDADDRLSQFLVVTTRPDHRRIQRTTPRGKPVDVLVIGGHS